MIGKVDNQKLSSGVNTFRNPFLRSARESFQDALRQSLTLLLTYPALTTVTFAFIIYLFTLAPGLTQAHSSGDGGELITASVTLGIPHPTGYPTYILLGKLFSYLPLGTIAYRFNLFSAVTTALAAGFVAATVKQTSQMSHPLPAKQQNNALAIAAGLSLAFTPMVWSQATITEVYGLNLLVVAIFAWACLRSIAKDSNLRSLASPNKSELWKTRLRFVPAAFFFGLAITTHATSILLFPLLLLNKRDLREGEDWNPRLVGMVPFGVAAFLLGLSPLLAIPWLAQTGSPIVWGNPTTADGWWWLVSGQLYRPNMLALPPDLLVGRVWAWGRELATAFTWAGLPLIAWGLFSLSRRKFPAAKRETAVLLLTATLTLIYALIYNTTDAHVLLLPTLLLLTLPLANGLRPFGNAALILPLALLLLNFSAQNLRQSPTIRPTAMTLLHAAPENAVLLTPGDTTIFALWYFHHVENERPDLLLVDSNLFAFDWYRERLHQRYPMLVATEHDDLAAFQQQNKRPFCHAQLWNPDPDIAQPYLTCSEEPAP